MHETCESRSSIRGKKSEPSWLLYSPSAPLPSSHPSSYKRKHTHMSFWIFLQLGAKIGHKIFAWVGTKTGAQMPIASKVENRKMCYGILYNIQLNWTTCTQIVFSIPLSSSCENISTTANIICLCLFLCLRF